MYITFALDWNSILFIIGILLCFVCHIITWVKLKRLSQSNERNHYLMYRIHKEFDQYRDTLYEVDEHTKQLHEGFAILQVAYKKVHEEKHMPNPQEAQQIEATIQDLLTIEVLLSRDMSIARRDSVNHIIKSTIQTYPEINTEYIVKKTTSVIQNFISNQA